MVSSMRAPALPSTSLVQASDTDLHGFGEFKKPAHSQRPTIAANNTAIVATRIFCISSCYVTVSSFHRPISPFYIGAPAISQPASTGEEWGQARNGITTSLPFIERPRVSFSLQTVCSSLSPALLFLHNNHPILKDWSRGYLPISICVSFNFPEFDLLP
jgi:hypothetical protein